MTTVADLHCLAQSLIEARADVLRALEIGPDPSGHLEAAQQHLHTAALAVHLAAARCQAHQARPAPPANPAPRRWVA